MRTFSITPKPRMLLGVQNQKWTVSGALAELLDNAFGPGRGNASLVKIIYDTTDRTLIVVDNGQGMEYIGRLFQLGNTIGRTVGDIGHYGSGGTQAIIWLPEYVHVATERDGQIMHDSLRWSEVFEMEDFRDIAVSNEWKRGALKPPAGWGHGTMIRMKLLKTRKINVSNVLRDLSRLFAPGLRNGKTITWIQTKGGEVVEQHNLTDPFDIKASKENTVHFHLMIEYENTHLPVNGVISFDENVSHADSLVRVGFGYREIMRTRDCFGSDDEAFEGMGVFGWLDLGDGWQPHLSTTKDGFDNQPLYEALMKHVFVSIRELLKKAQQRTMNFELDNIAIGLAIALEKTMKMKVTVKREDGGSGGGIGEGDGSSGGEGGDRDREPKGDDDASAVANVRLLTQTDNNMMGALARSGHDKVGLYVDINQEHAYVCEAMRQRPINAAALNLMIIHEIAALLTADDGLFQGAFKKSFIAELDNHEGPEKVRMLVRRLIDSVPDKRKTAA